MSSKLYNAYQLIRKGGITFFLTELKQRIYSRQVALGLQRDLENDFQAPEAKIDIQVRPLRIEDVAELLATPANSSINPRLIINQQNLVNAHIQTCYVAVTDNNKPCYMQWLIGYNNNPEIEKYFKGNFPPLKKHEALLEGAYCNPAYRGLRIMPKAMALIAEKAGNVNARWVNTFVDVTNIASLKGCERAGFKPYLQRQNRWFLFHRTVTFYPISKAMDEMFYIVTESARRKNNDNHQVPLRNHTPTFFKSS
ncbi:MAG: GNAT family N-acetyltransferase [Cyclonatronaceae bacterium]